MTASCLWLLRRHKGIVAPDRVVNDSATRVKSHVGARGEQPKNRYVARELLQFVPSGMAVVAVLAFTASSVLSQEFLSEEKAAKELQRLQELWQSQGQEVRTARIEGDHFELNINRHLDEAAVNPFVQAMDSALQVDADIADLESATQRLPLPPKRRSWGQFLFLMDGKHRRCRETWKSPDGQEQVSDFSFNGEQEVQRKSYVNQVNVLRGRSNFYFTALEDLRRTPFAPVASEGIAKLESINNNEIIRISTSKRTFSVYSVSGLIRDDTLDTQRTLQYQPAEFAGGIVFPRVSITIRTTPKFTRVDVYRMRKAEFNITVTPEEFRVPIPAGSTVVDMRHGTDRPRPFRSGSGGSDAIEVADKMAAPRTAAPADDVLKRDTWRVALVIINVSVVVLLAWLVFRKRQTQAKHA
jgi:hypothetical protein